MDLKAITQVRRERDRSCPATRLSNDRFTGMVNRDILGVFEDKLGQPAILALGGNPRTGTQQNLEAELAAEFEENDQVAGRVTCPGEIQIALTGLVDVPRHGCRDNSEIGLTDTLKADRPVTLGDTEVVHLCGERRELFFANDELMINDTKRCSGIPCPADS